MEEQFEAWKFDPDYHRTADFLGINKYDRDDYEMAQKVSILNDWARTRGAKDVSEQLDKINELKRSTGQQTLGKTLVNTLYNHVRLSVASKPLPKKASKPKAETKQTSKPVSTMAVSGKVKKTIENTTREAIRESIANTTKQTIAETAKKAMSDKKFIQSAVAEAMKGMI